MIGRSAFDELLNEYGQKRLAADQALHERKELIRTRVPQIKTIDDAIASFSVAHAVDRIRGGSGDDEYHKKIELLSAQKKRLLEENGFSEDDLKPHYECNKCEDTGYADGKICDCFRQKLSEKLYAQLDIRSAIADDTFVRFNPELYSREIPKGAKESPYTRALKCRDRALEFVRNFDSSSENLFITGEVGVGKTFLTNCIVSEIAKRGHFVIYLPATRFFDLVSDATFGRAEEGRTYITDYLYGCDLLVIDDLGTEMANSFVISTLFTCINERLLSKKHTIITTNLTLSRLNEIYDSRIYSRIIANYTCLQLLGDDIRTRLIQF